MLREELQARGRVGLALDERGLRRRHEAPPSAEAEGRAGRVQLECAERLLVEIAIFTA